MQTNNYHTLINRKNKAGDEVVISITLPPQQKELIAELNGKQIPVMDLPLMSTKELSELPRWKVLADNLEKSGYTHALAFNDAFGLDDPEAKLLQTAWDKNKTVLEV